MEEWQLVLWTHESSASAPNPRNPSSTMKLFALIPCLPCEDTVLGTVLVRGGLVVMACSDIEGR